MHGLYAAVCFQHSGVLCTVCIFLWTLSVWWPERQIASFSCNNRMLLLSPVHIKSAEAIVIDCRRLPCSICSLCEYFAAGQPCKAVAIGAVGQSCHAIIVNQEKYNDMQYGTQNICIHVPQQQPIFRQTLVLPFRLPNR